MATLKVNSITPSSGTALTITAATASISGTLTVPNITGTASQATNATNAANLTTVIAGLPTVATGSSTAIPVITLSNKGLTTVLTTAAVVAPAGTLTGTALPAAVVGSSLTSVGTLTGLTLGTTAVLTNNNTTDTTAYTNGSVVLKGGLGVTGSIRTFNTIYANGTETVNLTLDTYFIQNFGSKTLNNGYTTNVYTQLTSKATAVTITATVTAATTAATATVAAAVTATAPPAAGIARLATATRGVCPCCRYHCPYPCYDPCY